MPLPEDLMRKLGGGYDLWRLTLLMPTTRSAGSWESKAFGTQHSPSCATSDATTIWDHISSRLFSGDHGPADQQSSRGGSVHWLHSCQWYHSFGTLPEPSCSPSTSRKQISSLPSGSLLNHVLSTLVTPLWSGNCQAHKTWMISYWCQLQEMSRVYTRSWDQSSFSPVLQQVPF